MGALSADGQLAKAVAEGRIVFDGPRLCGGGLYSVDITDTVEGQTINKTFRSKGLATEWIASQMIGEKAPPRTGCSALDDDDEDPHARPSLGAAYGSGNYTHAAPKGRIRIGTVRDTLERYGLDPTVEIAKVLTARKPKTKRDGTPLLDEHGEPITEPVLDASTAAHVLVDLQQYVSPKLKAIEVLQKDDAPKTVEEIEAKIAQLLDRRKDLESGAVR